MEAVLFLEHEAERTEGSPSGEFQGAGWTRGSQIPYAPAMFAGSGSKAQEAGPKADAVCLSRTGQPGGRGRAVVAWWTVWPGALDGWVGRPRMVASAQWRSWRSCSQARPVPRCLWGITDQD